jgi:hypothetical protein
VWGEGLNIRALNGYVFADLDGRDIAFLKCCFARSCALLLLLCSFFLFPLCLKAEEIIPHNKTSITIDISSNYKRPQSELPLISLDDSRLFSDLSFLKLETFSGVDYTSNQIGFYSGGVSSLLGPYLNLPGLKLRAVYGRGYYQYRSSVRQGDKFVDVNFQGESEFYEAMVGYEFRLGKAILKAYTGLIAETNHIDPLDPQNSLEGTEYGAKFLLEGWYEFNSGQWLSSYGAYSTGNEYYVAHTRYGLPLFDDIPYIGAIDIGIEAGVFGNKEFDAVRFGGFSRHKTNFGELTFSAGISGDYEQPDSFYSTFQLYRKIGDN